MKADIETRTRFDRTASSTSTRSIVILCAILLPLFALNARWGADANVDAVAAAAPAWQLVEEGTLDLTSYSGQNPWLVNDKTGRLVSDRAPGLIVSAVPGYALWHVDRFINGPATLIALLATMIAVLLVWRLLTRWLGQGAALISALVLAFGTTTWSVSSSQLWPHGMGQLMAALVLCGLAAKRDFLAGLASAAAITLRPITAVYAGAVGLAEGWRRRELKSVVIFGAPACGGLLLVLVYNQWLFGQWTLRGGHASGLLGGWAGRSSLGGYLENLWTMFFSLEHGLFTLSPILLIATIGAIKHRDRLPGWAKSAGVSAVIYMFVHAYFNRASGGAEMFYRYPLEPIALSSVALILGANALYRSKNLGKVLVIAAAFASVTVQVINVFYLSCARGNPDVIACQLF